LIAGQLIKSIVLQWASPPLTQPDLAQSHFFLGTFNQRSYYNCCWWEKENS